MCTFCHNIVEQESTSRSRRHWKSVPWNPINLAVKVCNTLASEKMKKKHYYYYYWKNLNCSLGWNEMEFILQGIVVVWLNALENKFCEYKDLTTVSLWSCVCVWVIHVFLLLSEAELPWGLKYFGASILSLSLPPPSVHNHSHLPSPLSLFKHISTLLSPRKAKKLCRHGDSLPVEDRNVWLGGARAIFTAGRDTVVHNNPSWVLPSLSQCALYNCTYKMYVTVH